MSSPRQIVTRGVSQRLAAEERAKLDISHDGEPLRDSQTSRKSSSSTIKRKLKLEVEKEKLRIDIELAETKKRLLDEELAIDMAEVDSQMSGTASRNTESILVDKVEQWIDEGHNLETPPPLIRQPSPAHQAPLHGPLASPLPLELRTPLSPRHTLSPADPSRDQIGKLAETMKDLLLAASSQNPQQEILTRLSTSKDLPQFFGDSMEWLQFKQAYVESTELCKYTSTENMWRLRKCLKGEAKDAVSSLLIGDTTPDVVMDTLQLRFGRPECVMAKIVANIKKISPLPQNYYTEIVNFAIKVQNYVAAAKGMHQQDYLRSPELVTIIVSKIPSVLMARWADYLNFNNVDVKPRLEMLAEFLMKEATMIASAGVSAVSQDSKVTMVYDPKKGHHVNSVTSALGEKCTFCRQSQHALPDCKRFKQALKRDRWRFVRMKRLCFKCLKPQHDIKTCTAQACDVELCGQPHHRLLHWIKPQNTEVLKNEQGKSEMVTYAGHSEQYKRQENASRAVLKIVPIAIHGPQGTVEIHALLDDGATVTLIASDICDELGVSGDVVTMHARSAWNSAELTCKTELVNFVISNQDGSRFNLRARKMRELSLSRQQLLVRDVDSDVCKLSSEFVKPKLLIGQDNYNLIAPLECKPLSKRRDTFLTKTLLGWCLHGVISDRQADRLITHVFTLSDVYDIKNESDLELHRLVKQYFSLDSLGVSAKPRQKTDDVRALNILNNTAQLVDGRWAVGLPWREDDVVMPDSYPVAFKRLRFVQRKMRANEEFALRYRERVQHLLENNFARELGSNEVVKTNKIWYLPHFGVDNPNKNKLRLVFDAAAKTNGHSLNDFLLQGPDLLQSLLGIMLRFREYSVGILGDIKDMFLRINIRDYDQHALRFLWAENGEPVKTFVMTSLIFGANCSPFVAQYVNQNLNTQRFEAEMPEAVTAIQNSQYMDDYVDSQPSEILAANLIQQVYFIHSQRGFEMRNWTSNCPNVLKNMPTTILSDVAVKFDLEGQFERTLGLLWFPSDDTLGFNLSLSRIPKDILELKRIPTKRELLGIAMSVFDILGILAPFTVETRILVQDTWRQNVKWDQKIPDDIFGYFCEWITKLLHDIVGIRIPRWYFRNSQENNDGKKPTSKDEALLELHIFCDASPLAYAAVAYWRKQYEDGEVCVSFISSKCRVAPVKSISIPRLELQSALLACRLADTIKKEHRIKPSFTFFWTDSSTVLHWIRNQNKRYNVFVAHRLGEIDTLSSVSEWHYIPTNLNIADVATKRNNYKLGNDCTWFRGPMFLFSCDRSHWPREPESKILVDEQIPYQINVINDMLELPVPNPEHFSSWLCLIRSMARVLLFVNKCLKRTCELDSNMLKDAEEIIIRQAQSQTFLKEIHALKNKNEVNKDSRLLNLTPIIDNAGLLRVGGRIDACSDVSSTLKHPIILDGNHQVAKLIVKHYHKMAAHGYNEMVVNELRQKYWILRLRPTVRKIASQCLLCRIKKAKPQPPRMGDLPAARLQHHERPFTSCGVDLFGPVEVTIGRRREKRYGVLFTCLTVRAVHIELVPTLTSDSLIMALRRMAARRGWPRTLYSDNATNFRGADVDMKRSLRELDTEALTFDAVNKGVDWHFISPGSPHMGGAWERLIRSVKATLKVVLKERAPKEETLMTFLAEIENIINSRPLSHVSVDHNSEETLTPNHFLIGSSSNLPLLGVFTERDLCLRRQWRIAQQLSDSFWTRWVKEILPTLLPRQKWASEGGQLKVGDVVIVADPNSPRNTWPKGIIQCTYPGKDNRVRVVDIKCQTGVMRRPAVRVLVLPKVNTGHVDDTGAEIVDDGHSRL